MQLVEEVVGEGEERRGHHLDLARPAAIAAEDVLETRRLPMYAGARHNPGPGDPNVAHTAGERVDRAELDAVAAGLRSLLTAG